MYPIMDLSQMQEGELSGAERLHDVRFDWRDKKMRNIKLAHLYDVAGWKEMGDRAASCSTFSQFGANADGSRSLIWSNFCQLRLCPLCTARRAMKFAYRLNHVMNVTESRYEYEFIFLTLTVKSCDGNELGKTLGLLTKAWDRLMKQRPVKLACKGWYRAIEITRGDLGYHPHIHAVIAVEPAYFKRKSGQYITQLEWRRRWALACGLDYDPRVNIKKTYDKKGGMGAVLEASKYATKDSEYIDDELDEQEAAQIVVDYTTALYRRRLVAFGGVMKEIAAEMGADQEDNDLVHVDDETIRSDVAELIEEYGWHFGAGDYILTSRRVNPLRVVKADV